MAKAKDHCPTDVTSDILERLPVKTLTRFKCVSKPWLKLISDPFLVRSHRVRSQKGNPLQLFSTASSYDKKKGEERLHLSFFMGDEGPLLQECEFTVDGTGRLLSSYLGSVLCYVGFTSILAYNPSTRERVTLPSVTHCLDDCNEGKVGFAYLPDENEYKVVRLFYKRWVHHPADFFGDYEIGCEILTLRDGADSSSGHWRVVPDEYCPYPVCYLYPPCVNAAVHWLVHYEYREEHYEELDDEMIVSFDVEAEMFKMVPVPRICLGFGPYSMTLVALRGFLVLVSRCNDSEIEMWVLKDYDSRCWFKEYRIDLSGMDRFNMDFEYAIPKDIRDGNILMETYTHGPNRLDCYNVETKSFRKLIDLDSGRPGKLNSGCRRFHFYLYWESLFSLPSRACSRRCRELESKLPSTILSGGLIRVQDASDQALAKGHLLPGTGKATASLRGERPSSYKSDAWPLPAEL
ncbi:hypothetical protein RJ639_018767 [Escallonia herrerae]|uniref:F-box domain-containing protein n=1 Tax=Escallonia herrerae TaxID=1293975 RepID=A0AA88V9Z8_9ASTE|nr:hypothetical protein RJ639_018767 [Escallonia herrerae]